MDSLKGCGKVIALIGTLFLVPLLVLPFYPEEANYFSAFLIPAFSSMAIGSLIILISNYIPNSLAEARSKTFMSPMRLGSSPVIVSWCLAFALGSIPFILSEELSPLLALFESTSGWTTTGLTVADVDNLPHIFLFYRSFMQYCGGLGFIILITMVIHNRNIANMYKAEGHMDLIRPSLRDTAFTAASLYVLWLIIGCVAYVVCGMPVFDSVCHTMSALSTAGFSTQTDSIGAYNSVSIDIVTMFLMMIGATNFVVLLSLTKAKIKESFQDTEFKFMVKVTIISGLIASGGLVFLANFPVGKGLLHGFFGIITSLTTTGYTIDDFSQWPGVSMGVLIFLMIVGGCSGSTAGGIKMCRAYYLFINARHYFQNQLISPIAVKTSFYKRNHANIKIDTNISANASAFLFCYLLILGVGTLIITVSSNCDLSTAAFEFTSALGTVGISNGLTAPDASAITLITEIIAMVLGRLEFVLVFIGLYSIAGDMHILYKFIRNKEWKS